MAKGPREVLYEGRYLRLVREAGWEFAERKNASGVVALVPVTDAGEIVLVEQHRVPTGTRVIELCAGLAGDIQGQEHEALEAAAQRELQEETGYRARTLKRVLSGPSSAGSSSALITVFLALGLEKVGPGGGDEHEDITVHVVPLGAVEAWLLQQQAAGKALDPKIYAGLWFARSTA